MTLIALITLAKAPDFPFPFLFLTLLADVCCALLILRFAFGVR